MRKCVNRYTWRGRVIYTCSRTRKSSLFSIGEKRMKGRGKGKTHGAHVITPLAGPSGAQSHTGRSERENALEVELGKSPLTSPKWQDVR